MDERIRNALAITPASSASARTVDITTIGAKTGRPRRIEIWFYRVDGEIYLTTQPARRAWYANLLRNPDFTFHLKGAVRADLAATAAPVVAQHERARVFTSIIADLDQPLHRFYISQPVQPLEQWMTGSPLMHVTFSD
ncbi:nitroreductase/quinone reductase family protein [Microbacterium xanthum]|uniref:nitroreductase/quinone reductase family protein n=1 Tax=Microbacterium xanthum TaxID=3079794 RepID=UPI002AD596CF|nr:MULTISPECIES: nitroreductase/quinone reductase family protein [unclassified Microbacterium]MDZ8171978.1 nitroreductase/quinone reductase family protein [Microbacterium sp. KSW-48]MDZ8199931.1 nitroreductase/quinone reductase family protein [Microbacterium sp. SSW1-59]